MPIKSISILGTGWLGLPLAEHLIYQGHHIKASTTSDNRLAQLATLNIDPFIIELGQPADRIQEFLQSNILIINIPLKKTANFKSLISEIEKSEIKKVLFVSSTSVYENHNLTIFESDGMESMQNSLLAIENLFINCYQIKTAIVRFGGLIGYARNPANFFSERKLISNPDSTVNLIHRDDCIGIINQIIEQEVWGEIFNCCADTHPTKEEFYTQMSKNMQRPLPVFENTNTTSFKIISNKKVKKILHYEFIHSDLMKIRF